MVMVGRILIMVIALTCIKSHAQHWDIDTTAKTKTIIRDIEMLINDTLLIRINLEKAKSLKENFYMIHDIKNNRILNKSDSLTVLGKKPNWKNLLAFVILTDSTTFYIQLHPRQDEIVYYIIENTMYFRTIQGIVFHSKTPYWKYKKNKCKIYIQREGSKTTEKIGFIFTKSKWKITRTQIDFYQ